MTCQSVRYHAQLALFVRLMLSTRSTGQVPASSPACDEYNVTLEQEDYYTWNCSISSGPAFSFTFYTRSSLNTSWFEVYTGFPFYPNSNDPKIVNYGSDAPNNFFVTVYANISNKYWMCKATTYACGEGLTTDMKQALIGRSYMCIIYFMIKLSNLTNTNFHFFVETVRDWNHLEERVGGSGSVGDFGSNLSCQLD